MPAHGYWRTRAPGRRQSPHCQCPLHNPGQQSRSASQDVRVLPVTHLCSLFFVPAAFVARHLLESLMASLGYHGYVHSKCSKFGGVLPVAMVDVQSRMKVVGATLCGCPCMLCTQTRATTQGCPYDVAYYLDFDTLLN